MIVATSGSTKKKKKNSDSTGDWVWNLSPSRGEGGDQIIDYINVLFAFPLSGFTDVAIGWIGRTRVLRRGFLEF